jgi:vacuolar-type H+-ATPase subunit C/Vma6
LYLKHIKEISQENYITIGPTIRFLVSKEFEIRNLKAIAKGISENIGSDLIKEILITEVQN